MMSDCVWEGCSHPATLRLTAEQNRCDDGTLGDPVYACDYHWNVWLGFAEQVAYTTSNNVRHN